MDKKFEINLNKLFNSYFQKPLESEDFKESKNTFSIFDLNKDGKIDDSEVGNICRQLFGYTSKNTSDTRKEASTIFDEAEAESFIKENKDQSGQTLEQLGITVKEVFNFLNTLLQKADDNQMNSNEEEVIVPLQKEKDQLPLSFDDGALVKENAVELTDEQENIAKELANIPERKEQQFSREDCVQLAQLTKDELEKAKQLFFISGREKQFSANDIIMLVTECGGKYKVNKENYQSFEELLLLKNSDQKELSGEDIIRLMSLSADKIDSAKQLLNLKNRAEKPLSISDIISIVNCDSDELINAVIENPNLTDFEESRSISGRWLSVTDSTTGMTFRYIKGQPFPEEITEEKIDDKTFKRIINNKNLKIQQTMFFSTDNINNPLRIETKHLSENGEVAYTEVIEQSKNPGTPDIYTIDSNGNKTYLQQTIVDEQTGVQITKKKFTDDNGNLTEFSYSAISENEYSVDYRVTDAQGNELFTKQNSLKCVGNNAYEYTYGKNTYLIETQDDKVIVTDKLDNKSYTINYSDYIDSNDNPDIFKQNILKIPADILIFISKNPLSLSYGTKTKENQGYCRVDEKAIDIGRITKTNSDKELNEAFITIIIHELGHYIDNPNLSEDDKDIISMNEEFLRIYNEELNEFAKNHSTEEQQIMLQFNGIGYQSKSPETQVKRSAAETLAESNMITNTNSKSWTSSRSYYLQRYFPKTIAFASKLIQERLQK